MIRRRSKIESLSRRNINPRPSRLNPVVNGERKERERATPEMPRSRPVWFEPVAVVLLSLATVGTAWCSYQAAVWSAVSQRTMNQSAARGRHAVADQLKAVQLATVDVLLFSQYINAHAASNETLMRF